MELSGNIELAVKPDLKTNQNIENLEDGESFDDQDPENGYQFFDSMRVTGHMETKNIKH